MASDLFAIAAGIGIWAVCFGLIEIKNALDMRAAKRLDGIRAAGRRALQDMGGERG